jgi:O-acetyl-ADP-ribose deacetylase (regulator of RNase III)
VIEIVRGDITTLDVDAIVNAANSALIPGGGVDGAINRAAGPGLARAMAAFHGCKTGNAVITPAFNLKAKYVIHAVGPIWHGGNENEEADLRRAYESAFERAASATTPPIRSIAFPAISTGIYGFPKDRAADVALLVMQAHESRFDRIIACLFDQESLELYRYRLNEPG